MIVLICMLGSACGQVQPSAEPVTPNLTPEPTLPTTLTLRIRLNTTSDWTQLFLVSGATWSDPRVVSKGEGANTAEISGDHLTLDQAISRADAGKSTEMLVEVTFADWANGEPISFEINRGNIGSTQVEFSRQVGDEWEVIKTFTWGGITGDGQNARNVDISIEELLGEIVAPTTAPQELEAAAVAPVTGMPEGTDGYPWWNDTVFYEIFVRSFYDSNGDGIGDLNGIIQKLDYLNDGDPNTTTDLGITGIWLMPIFPSPTYHGYNVTDYYNVNPQYGTLDDLRNLLDAAHARGIRIILDISFGQTSSQHPWFIAAESTSSPYHDWYIWSNYDPGYLGSWGQQVWFPLNGRYYYGTFSAYSPDLNFRNPDVIAESQKIARFWLEGVGVDGFRLDSAKHIIEEGTIQANSDSTHDYWKIMRPIFKQSNPQSLTVAEIWEDTPINAKYVQGDEVDISFEFWLAWAIIDSVKSGNTQKVNDQIEISYSLIPQLRLGTFLTNHDLDRLMDDLDYDPGKVKAAASVMMTAPGVPFLYYGEEIGMEGQKPDEQIRAPMQWSKGRYADFSNVTPWQPLGPEWQNYNVAVEIDDPASMLSHYKALVQARNQHAALRVGDMSLVTTGNDGLFSIVRVSQQEAILVLVNITNKTITDYALQVDQSSLAQGSYTPVAIMGNGEFAPLSVNSIGGFS
jgi:glycosidase